MSCILLIISTILSGTFAESALEGIVFRFYPSSNASAAIDFLPLPTPISRIPIDASYPSVKFLCHGWMDNGTSYWYRPTVDAYHARGERNVLSVDWNRYSREFYTYAMANAKLVGEDVGRTVVHLHQQHGIPLEAFHLIGHSLGSHVMAYAGQYIANRMKGAKVGRLTGLDPAGPGFMDLQPDERLSREDAKFVDIIHTHTVFFGFKTGLGHVDFWPNGGEAQPGCVGLIGALCSHIRATMYFTESIRDGDAFPAWFCDSQDMFTQRRCFNNMMVYMGEDTPRNMRGMFYLETNPSTPFGKGLDIK